MAACTNIADQQSSRTLPDSSPQSTTAPVTSDSSDESNDATSDDTATRVDPTAEARGNRIDADGVADEATPAAETPEPAIKNTPEPAAQPTETAPEENEDTAAAATDPSATAQPVTNAATPTAEPPTPEPVATPTSTPVPIVVQPTTGPVPSDDIVVTGPDVDESGDPASISDAAVSACISAERAIEFLDFGDLSRTATTLDEAAGHAAAASEPAINALATQLAAVGEDEDAAFDAIVAMLTACVSVGYQV